MEGEQHTELESCGKKWNAGKNKLKIMSIMYMNQKNLF